MTNTNNKILRVLCLLLSLLMVMSLMLACAEEDKTEKDPTPETPNDNPNNDNPENPNNPENPDNPENPNNPEDPQNPDEIGPPDYLMQVQVPQGGFGGEDIVILCRADKEYEIDVTAQSGALVEKAVYERNARVEEYLDVEITSFPVNGSWQLRPEFIAVLANAVATTDNSFQIVATHSSYNAGLTLSDQYYNLLTLTDSIDLSAPWWSSSWVENATVFDKLFYVTGDVSLTMWEELYAVFFNRDMVDDRQGEIGDLYQMVRDHEWTLENMAMLSQIYIDVNGDDEKNVGDTFGLVINRHAMRALVTSCDLPIAARNEDGGFDLVFMDDDHAEKVETVYTTLYDLVYQNEGTFDSLLTDGDYTEMLEIFTTDGALFMTGTLNNANALRNADMKFGILPFPKYDYDQEEYLSHSYDGLSSFSVPACATAPQMCAKVLDAMGAESKYSVIPAYYEVVLQGRVAQDADSKEMLNIIRENLFFDFGFIYSDALKGPGTTAGPFAFFGDKLREGKESLSAAWASVYDIYLAKLDEVMAKFAQ